MNSDSPTRISLIEKIKDPHNAEAWSEFTAIYYPLIFDICRSKGLQYADATDITQEVLSRVIHAINGYHHQATGSTFRGWLYTITRNLTVDFFRRQQNDPLATANAPGLLEIPEPSAAECREFQLAYRRQMFSVVAGKVQTQVTTKTWQMFWKTEIEQLSVADAARQFQTTAGAVYVARSRVISKLRREIQRRSHETDHPTTANPEETNHPEETNP